MKDNGPIPNHILEVQLDNGIKVLILENHKAPLVTFQVWYRVGSRDEDPGKSGLSHLMEHMMFKGTRKVGPEAFSRIIQEHGGNTNAFTTKDYTAYFEIMGSDVIDVALELESDRMAGLCLRQKDFQTEKMVVMEERRLRTENQPESLLIEELDAIAFRNHPYRWPVVGWMEDLERLSLSDVKRHFSRYYCTENALIVMAGDLKKRQALKKIKALFECIPRRNGPRPATGDPSEPAQLGERRVRLEKEASLPYLAMAYHVPNISDPDGYPLELLAALLAHGKTSRLYKRLVSEEQWVVDVETDYSLLSIEPGLFYIHASCLPGRRIEGVERIIQEEIERIGSEGVSENELQKVVNQKEAMFVYNQDSVLHQGFLLAQFEISCGWRGMYRYLPGLRAVTSEDISRVARKYLSKENRTVGHLIPVRRLTYSLFQEN